MYGRTILPSSKARKPCGRLGMQFLPTRPGFQACVFPQIYARNGRSENDAAAFLGDRVDGIKALVAIWPRTRRRSASFGTHRWWAGLASAADYSAGEGSSMGVRGGTRMMTQ